MDTKVACCGCSGCGCFLIIISIIVGGYFGFSFLKSSGRGFVAFSFQKAMENLVEDSLPSEDKKEVLTLVDGVKKEISDGKIGLFDLFKEGTSGVEGNTYLKSLILGFKNLYLTKAESDENIKIVNRFLGGIYSEHIDTYKAASLTSIISQRYSKKMRTSSSQKGKIKYEGKRLNKKLSPEKVQQAIKVMQDIISKYEVPVPAESFDGEKLFKKDVIGIIKRLKSISENASGSSKIGIKDLINEIDKVNKAQSTASKTMNAEEPVDKKIEELGGEPDSNEKQVEEVD